MGHAMLDRTTKEMDFGVTFSADMKVSEQCAIAASKGNQILGLIRRTITWNEKPLIVRLYIYEWNKLSNDCVTASSMNIFKKKIYRYLMRTGYTHSIVGLLISQLLPCLLTIRNL